MRLSLLGALLAFIAPADGRARDWSAGPERIAFDMGVVGLVAVDDFSDDKQLGGMFGAHMQRWGPLTLELMAFGSGGATGDPAVAGERAAGYTLVGLVPGIGVEFGRGPATFGVGLFCRPPIIAVLPDAGRDVVRAPTLRRTFFRLPNFALIMGDDRFFVEIGGGGDPTPIEPRMAYITYNWRDTDWSGSGGAAGLSALGVVQADGEVVPAAMGLAFHLAGWFEIDKGMLLGLRADISTLVSLGLTFTYVQERVHHDPPPEPSKPRRPRRTGLFREEPPPVDVPTWER